jgi:hypothetical protein
VICEQAFDPTWRGVRLNVSTAFRTDFKCSWSAPLRRRLRCSHHHGQDEKALIRLRQEKRGEIGPEDRSTTYDAIIFSLPCEIAPRRRRRFPR